MNKLVLMINSKKDLELVKNKNILGIILSIKSLSVNSSFFIEKEDISDIIKDNPKKEIFVSLNKIMHNKDIEKLKETLIFLNKIPNIKVLFYDMSILNIVKENNLNLDLVIYQDHLNASIYSNIFYNKHGINYSFITSDITLEEINEIKTNTNMKLMKLVYGYIPIFYSRRYLITNYLNYIKKDKENNHYFIKEKNINYPICEEEYGTTIYSSKQIDLINELENLNVDYYVINSYLEPNIDLILNKYINNIKDNNDNYLGFLKTKTIFKVK